MLALRKFATGSLYNLNKSCSTTVRWASCWTGHSRLCEDDPEIWDLLKEEKKRQKYSLNLTSSENFCSRSALEALGSCLNNKYASGYPGRRLFAGTDTIDKIELLCQKRALDAFSLDHERWGVNVQPLSGTPSNFEAYTALLKPHDRIMGLHVYHGGTVSHGFMHNFKRISGTSIYFETMPYKLDCKTELIDYGKLQETARLFTPRIIIAGATAYAQLLNYKCLKEISDSVGAVLMGDIAEIAGLVAAGVIPSPFEYCDVVTTATHTTLRGARHGLIFYRRGVKELDADGKATLYDYENHINSAVFPALQGGPHVHSIAAVAVTLKQACTPEFCEYQRQVLANAHALGCVLHKHGYALVSECTKTHMVLVDLRTKDLDGTRVEAVCNRVSITLNKYMCPRDTDPHMPSGLRMGVAALTTRQFREREFEKVVEFLDRVVNIAAEVKARTGCDIKEFMEHLNRCAETVKKLDTLKSEIHCYSSSFPMPGFDDH